MYSWADHGTTRHVTKYKNFYSKYSNVMCRLSWCVGFWCAAVSCREMSRCAVPCRGMMCRVVGWCVVSDFDVSWRVFYTKKLYSLRHVILPSVPWGTWTWHERNHRYDDVKWTLIYLLDTVMTSNRLKSIYCLGVHNNFSVMTSNRLKSIYWLHNNISWILWWRQIDLNLSTVYTIISPGYFDDVK